MSPGCRKRHQDPPPPPPPPPPTPPPPPKPPPPDDDGAAAAIVPTACVVKESMLSANTIGVRLADETYQPSEGAAASPSKACAHSFVQPKTMAYGRYSVKRLARSANRARSASNSVNSCRNPRTRWS